MEERTWLWVKEVEWVLVMKNSEEETKGNYQRGCGGCSQKKVLWDIPVSNLSRSKSLNS